MASQSVRPQPASEHHWEAATASTAVLLPGGGSAKEGHGPRAGAAQQELQTGAEASAPAEADAGHGQLLTWLRGVAAPRPGEACAVRPAPVPEAAAAAAELGGAVGGSGGAAAEPVRGWAALAAAAAAERVHCEVQPGAFPVLRVRCELSPELRQRLRMPGLLQQGERRLGVGTASAEATGAVAEPAGEEESGEGDEGEGDALAVGGCARRDPTHPPLELAEPHVRTVTVRNCRVAVRLYRCSAAQSVLLVAFVPAARAQHPRLQVARLMLARRVSTLLSTTFSVTAAAAATSASPQPLCRSSSAAGWRARRGRQRPLMWWGSSTLGRTRAG